MSNATQQSDHLELCISNPFLTLQNSIKDYYSSYSVPYNSINDERPQFIVANIYAAKLQKCPSKKDSIPKGIKKQPLLKQFKPKDQIIYKQQHQITKDKIRLISFDEIKQKIQNSEQRLQNSKKRIPLSKKSLIKQIKHDNQQKILKQNQTKYQNPCKRISKAKFQRLSLQLPSENLKQSKNQFFEYKIDIQKITKKKIQKNIYQDNENQKQNKFEETRFYKKLKKKLQLQIKKIQDKNNPNLENILFQGCQVLNQEKKNTNHRRSHTDRINIRNSVSRVGLQFKLDETLRFDKRPKTARSQTARRKQIDYMSARSNELFKDHQQRIKTHKSTKRSLTIGNQTFAHIVPIYKHNNYIFDKKIVRKEKMKEKMLGILEKCQDHVQQFVSIDSGFKVFESFTNQMNHGLNQASKNLQQIQYFCQQDAYA